MVQGQRRWLADRLEDASVFCLGLLEKEESHRSTPPEHCTSWPTVTITTSPNELDQACESVSVMEVELDDKYYTGDNYCELLV